MSAIVFVVFSVLSGVSPDMGEASAYYLIIVRMLLGLAVGAASALVPAYMSEMAPAKARGRLSGLNQTMIVSGMLLSYVVDFLLKDLPGEWAWRLMLGLAAVPALILFLGVLRLPEHHENHRGQILWFGNGLRFYHRRNILLLGG